MKKCFNSHKTDICSYSLDSKWKVFQLVSISPLHSHSNSIVFYFVGKGEVLPPFNQYFWILPPKQSSSMGTVCKTFSENAKKPQKFITKHVYRCLLCFSQFNSHLNILKYQKIYLFFPTALKKIALKSTKCCFLKFSCMFFKKLSKKE